MEYVIIGLVTLIGSGLTLFSGFGLGTLLMPVMALFFPVDIAIALTAIVHFLNNLFKFSVFWKNINYKIALKFGLPSILAAFAGAYILVHLSEMQTIFSYSMFGKTFSITPIKIIIAILLAFFSVIEISPKLSSLQFNSKYLFLGGLLSGFFGGLSGNQGALRSAFLIRTGLSKEAFIATGVVIACLVDTTRLTIYSGKIISVGTQIDIELLFVATLSAFIGIYFGNKVLKKITVKTLHYIVAIFLFSFAILLGLGIL